MMNEPTQPSEESIVKAYDARLLLRIMAYLQPHRRLLYLGGVFLVLSTTAQILGPYITKLAIDRYVVTGNLSGLNLMVAAYVAAVVSGFVFLLAQRYILEKTGQRAMHDLRLEIFRHLQRQDASYFDHHPVGRLMTRNIHDVETLQELFSTGVVGLLTDSCMVLGIAAIMFVMSWQLALIAIGVLVIICYVSRFYRRRARQVFRESRAVLATLNSWLQESISGIATIKSFGRERQTFARFSAINGEYRDILLRSVHYNAMFFPIIEVFAAVTIGLILWYGGVLIRGDVILPGVVVAFIQYIQRMYQPIRDIAEKYNIMQAAMASSERIFGLLDTPPAISNPARTKASTQKANAVEFRDVWFSYHPGEPVLRGISFSVPRGTKIALVGPTGHGKTSILAALCRFYEIERGQILVDGTDVREWNKQELRSRMGLVLQDPFLFSGTIAKNITLGDERIDRRRMIDAAKKARIHGYIERLPLGYEHEVHERGATLSQGQRQLLSIARALAFDPQILLLDEATSSVDTRTEMLIREAIHELLQQRTALVVAHRLSTIRDADRILVIHNGQITESGTHEHLLRRGGLYTRLYELQFENRPQATTCGTSPSL